MKTNPSYEASCIRNVLIVLRDLMNGGRHSRHTVAARGGCSLVTADRWIRSLLVIPGCRLVKVSKTTWIEYVQRGLITRKDEEPR